MSEPNNSITNFSSSEIFVSNEPTINIFNSPDGSIIFKQQTPYKISAELYAQWPKFYSIVLDKGDHQIVSLEFRNNPDLSSLNKILNLFEAKHEYREVLQGENQQILRITENGIQVIAYLYHIYNNISTKASDLLSVSLTYMTEDMMEKTVPTWKQDISIRLLSWLEDEYDVLKENGECILRIGYAPEYGEEPNNSAIEILKERFRNYSQEERSAEFKKMTSELVYKAKQKLLEEFDPVYIKEMSYFKKFANLEKIFDTPDKCDQYLYQKNLTIQPLTERMCLNIGKKLTSLDSSVMDNIGKTVFSDTNLKHTKVTGSGVGSTLKLLLDFGIIGVKSTVSPIFNILDALKIVSSVAYGVKELYVEENDKKVINYPELAKSFSCKISICTIDSFINLTPDSQEKLSYFYAGYIYAATKEFHHYPSESYLASSLLDNLSNQTYTEKLGLKSHLNQNLEKLDGTSISILEYNKQHNQTKCYEEILQDLMGRDANTGLETSTAIEA
ncbi:MAG: hypothetical protein N4A31_02165 [Rickettsiales bacterium]|jgi:hypothetical protein|nr:hypothetical protein [Rickettsiales bacterium]